MDKNAFSYLIENKDKYPKEILIEKLRSSGYLENVKVASVAEAYGSSDGDKKIWPGVPMSQGRSFWDFKSAKSYDSGLEKTKDFLFGFFAPWVVGTIGGLIPIVGPMAVLAFFIYVLVYLFNRRRYIFYGMLAEAIVSLALAIIFIAILFDSDIF